MLKGVCYTLTLSTPILPYPYAAMLNFSWIDILMLLIIARGVYTGSKGGIILEIIRAIGVLCAIFITLHFYTRFGGLIKRNLSFLGSIHEILAFILLATFTIFIFYLSGAGWRLIFKIEVHSLMNKWGGVVIALVGSYLMCGLVFLGLIVSNNAFIQQNVKRSLSQVVVKDAPLGLYRFLYSRFTQPFFPDEPINTKIFGVVEALRGGKRQRLN